MFGSMVEWIGELVPETEPTRNRAQMWPTTQQCVHVTLAKDDEGLDQDVSGGAHGGGGGDRFTQCEKHNISKMWMAGCLDGRSVTGLYKGVSHILDQVTGPSSDTVEDEGVGKISFQA